MDGVEGPDLRMLAPGLKLEHIERVFGSASLPPNLDVMKTLAPGAPIPFEFFVRVKFKDVDQLEKFEEQLKKESKTRTIGGKEFYASPSPNLIAHRFDELSFEAGTESYLLQPERAFMTDRLKEAYDPIRESLAVIAVDLKTNEKFFADAVEEAKTQFDQPVVSSYLDLIDNADSLTLAQSWTGKNLLSLVVQGKDDSEAEELKEGLDSLVGIAQMGAKSFLSRGPADAKESLAFGRTLIESLAVAQDGTVVKLELPKPEGFEESLKTASDEMRAQAAKIAKMNDLRQISLSVHNYGAAYGKLPFKSKTDEVKGRHEKLSWRVEILPFLEEMKISDQMDVEKSPADAVNSKFADKMPTLFGPDGKNSNISWIQSETTDFAEITDGTSNTVMLIENPKGRPWMEQNPLTVDQAIELVSSLPDGEQILIGMYDGSVRKISNQVDKETLRWLFTPDDGNVIQDGVFDR